MQETQPLLHVATMESRPARRAKRAGRFRLACTSATELTPTLGGVQGDEFALASNGERQTELGEPRPQAEVAR